jgi:hypothetical protein
MHFSFVQICRGLKSCTFFLENYSFRILTRQVRGFSIFRVCPSNKHCISARCAYAATVVGKGLDISAIGAVFLNHVF